MNILNRILGGLIAAEQTAISCGMSMNTTPQGAFPDWHGTTIIAVRKNGRTVIAGDGQVSMGPTIVKGAARKVRVLAGGKVLAASPAPRPTPSP